MCLVKIKGQITNVAAPSHGQALPGTRAGFEPPRAAWGNSWGGLLTRLLLSHRGGHRLGPGFVRGFAVVRKNTKPGTYGAL